MTTTVKQSSKHNLWYLHCAISLLLMIGFRFLPAPDPITPHGMTCLGLFFGAIYAWCTTNMYWPSLLALVLYGFVTGVSPVQLFGTMLANPNVALMFWLFLAVGLMQSTKLSEYLAQWSFDKATHMKTSPWIIVAIALVAFIAVSAFINIAAVVLFWPIFHDFFLKAGYEKGKKEIAWITLTLVLFNITAMILMPFNIAVVSNFGFTAAASNGMYDGTFNYAAFMGLMLVIQTVDLILYLLISKFIFKIDLSKISEYKSETRFTDKMSKRQIIAFVSILVMAAVLIFPSFAPHTSFIYSVINLLGTGGVGMCMVAFYMFLQVDGEPLVKFEDLSKNIMWPVIFLFGTALTLCNSLNTPEAGISAFLQGILSPIFSGMSPFVFVFVFALICLVATNIINNVVVSAIMLTLAFPLCQSLGVNPLALTACSIMFIDFAWLLPSSSPAGAIIHSVPDWCPKKYLFKYGFVALVLLFCVSMFIGWPMANMLLPWSW